MFLIKGVRGQTWIVDDVDSLRECGRFGTVMFISYLNISITKIGDPSMK